MSLAEELNRTSKKAVEDKALTIALAVEQELRGYAANGHRECFMNVSNENTDVCLSTDFIEALNTLLDGVKVEVVERSTSVLFPSFKRKDIRFSW